MQTVVDRAVLLQQVSDYAVQQLVAELQERLDHLENTLAAMVAGAYAGGAPVNAVTPAVCQSVSAETAAGDGRDEDALAEVLKNGRLAAVLARAGYGTTTAVAGAGDEQLLGIDGVSEKALRQIRERIPAVGLLASQ
ncbi:MAG: hypothetical protein U0X20_22110 [Caldilineaceae bacterium]